MKKIALCVLTFTLLTGLPAMAQPGNRGDDRGWQQNDRDNRDRRDERRWSKGDRLPREFRRNEYFVDDWRNRNLRPPPRGYRWAQLSDQYILVSTGNGLIADIVLIDNRPPPPPPPPRFDDRANRDQLWRQRYSRTYSFNDDRSYNECRNKPDPAGIMVGAVLGGLLGNVAGRQDTGATVAGVIAGGAIAAALTSKLDCEDRSYAYKTYADGFNAGRPNARYEWRNPSNNHRGEMHVLDYYDDEDRFHCAVFSHVVYIDGRPQEARGRACQQPDGAWAIID